MVLNHNLMGTVASEAGHEASSCGAPSVVSCQLSATPARLMRHSVAPGVPFPRPISPSFSLPPHPAIVLAFFTLATLTLPCLAWQCHRYQPHRWQPSEPELINGRTNRDRRRCRCRTVQLVVYLLPPPPHACNPPLLIGGLWAIRLEINKLRFGSFG